MYSVNPVFQEEMNGKGNASFEKNGIGIGFFLANAEDDAIFFENKTGLRQVCGRLPE